MEIYEVRIIKILSFLKVEKSHAYFKDKKTAMIFFHKFAYKIRKHFTIVKDEQKFIRAMNSGMDISIIVKKISA